MSLLQKQQDDLTVLKRNTEECRDFASNTLHNVYGTNSEVLVFSAKKQMLERMKHLKDLHDGSQLCPVSKPTKTVCYQLDKINMEIEQVAVFVDLQQCCIENVPAKVYESEMVTFNVILKDTKSQPICNAANILTIRITTEANNEVASSVKELGDGKYSVSFTPVAPVEHVVSVQINGIEVSKSIRIQCCEVEYADSSDSSVDISPPVSLPTFNFNEL